VRVHYDEGMANDTGPRAALRRSIASGAGQVKPETFKFLGSNQPYQPQSGSRVAASVGQH
jgi:hypothetical protein